MTLSAIFKFNLRALLVSAILFSTLKAITVQADDADLVPLKPKLPAPAFVGTPKDLPTGSNIEKPSDQSAAPLMIPREAKNIAPAAKISCSDTNAKPEALAKITDGNKEAEDASIVLLRKGVQYVQFGFDKPQQISAIIIWHAHDSPKVYHGVVVQVADNADFNQNVRTLFNNDAENVDGLGAGTNHEYFETYQGKTIDAKGATAQYVRLYSKGNTDSSLNEYTEVEIYGYAVK